MRLTANGSERLLTGFLQAANPHLFRQAVKPLTVARSATVFFSVLQFAARRYQRADKFRSARPSPAQREDSLVRAQAMSKKLKGTAFENIPLIGSLSQVGGLSDISDDCRFQEKIRRLYE